MPYREGEKGSTNPKMIDLTSSGLGRYASLDNKRKQKYGSFDELSLELIGACEVFKNPHIFLTMANQNIQEISRQFDGTSNRFGPMVFVANQEHNESYTFNYMLLQVDNSYFILSLIKEVEAHEARSHWTIMKNSEVNNKKKHKYGKLKTIYTYGLSGARDSHMED